MTNEQAINELKKDKALYMPEEWIEELDRDTPDGRLITALDMAIEALEQQSEDCVSRQAVLNKAELVELEDGQTFYCISPEDVEALSPVTPTQCIAAIRFSKEDLRDICNERIEVACKHGT